MFLGESLCLLTYWAQQKFCRPEKTSTSQHSRLHNESDSDDEDRNYHHQATSPDTTAAAQSWSPVIFLLPACCDMTGTSLMYVGLNLTHASVFQMLRGSVVLFTGVFSVFFLGRKLHAFHWVGMTLVLVGTAVVGVDSVINGGSNSAHASNPMLGNIIIVVAQVVTAVQMVVEEKLVSGKGIPALQAVGWEGVWGFSVLSCALVGMYYLKGSPELGDKGSQLNHFEDTPDAIAQIGNSGKLFLACLANVLSIAFFNFFGLSVTKYMSATHRMVLDSLRTIVIWAFSLLVGWQSFSWLQLVGFVVLLSGTMVYNEIVLIPGLYYPEPTAEELKQRRNSVSLLGAAAAQTLADPLMDGNGETPTSPKADEWFSPKLTHYTQGRA